MIDATGFSVEAARRAAREDHLEEWLHAFLTDPGGNEPLSLGLKRARRWWLGPLPFPLALLTRCLGPEEGMEYRVPVEHWQRKTEDMRASLRRDWQPPPLLVVYQTDGTLSIRDGNNRYGALVKAGFQTYWTIFWFNTADDAQTFTATYARYLSGSGDCQ